MKFNKQKIYTELVKESQFAFNTRQTINKLVLQIVLRAVDLIIEEIENGQSKEASIEKDKGKATKDAKGTGKADNAANDGR